MRVVIQLFAAARESVGQSQIEIELEARATVGELRAALGDQYPALNPLLPHSLIAIDTHYATNDTVVAEGSEIACIPPVSGG